MSFLYRSITMLLLKPSVSNLVCQFLLILVWHLLLFNIMENKNSHAVRCFVIGSIKAHCNPNKVMENRKQDFAYRIKRLIMEFNSKRIQS